MIIYRSYYVVKGLGQSNISKINAFDSALISASIGEANLVPVSSILPSGCLRKNGIPKIEIGEVVFCVMARQDGIKGEKISAGLAHVLVRNRKNQKFGLVMEHHGKYKKEQLIRKLRKMITEMAYVRSLSVEDISLDVSHIDSIKTKYASVVVACVFR